MTAPNGGNFFANVKHIHPPISDSEFKEEAEGGLDDAACCASSLSWLDRFIGWLLRRDYWQWNSESKRWDEHTSYPYIEKCENEKRNNTANKK
jgi:hypothetical protein